MAWMKEIEEKKDFKALSSSISNSGYNFESLDFKIATGLWKILNGDFQKKLMNEERAHRQADPHFMMTGRQLAFRIFEHFKLPESRKIIRRDLPLRSKYAKR